MTHPDLYELSTALDVLDMDLNTEDTKRAHGFTDVRTTNENLELLLALKDQQRRLAAIVNEIERTAAQQIPRRTFQGEGLKAEKTRSYADEWDVRRTAWAVVEPLLCDDTGEVLCGEATAWALIDRLFVAASVKYYRAGELIKLGLNPEEFRTREFRRYTVKVERVDTEAGAT